MAIQETDPLAYRSTQEQKEHEEVEKRLRTTRRRFLALGGAVLVGGTVLILSGKGEEILDKIASEDNGPTGDQKDAYRHLVVEKFDVIPNLILVGEPGFPSKLRDKPYTEREFGKSVGKVVSQIRETVDVGDGCVVLGNDPSEQHRNSNKDPWIAILNPDRDKSQAPEPDHVVFSHYGNFVLTDEQRIQVLKAAQRLAS